MTDARNPVPIAPELANFWNVVTKPPYDEDKKKRSEKRRRGRAVTVDLGQDGNLEDLEPLPMDDEPNLQIDGMENLVQITAKRKEAE
jgi:hypothetical protein